MTVTYGDRFGELSSGPLAVAESLGCKIVVVCNGISDNYRHKLNEYIKTTSVDVKFIFNDVNLGSSGGFYAGIEYCSYLSFGWVLILDDDNLVCSESIRDIDESKLGVASFMSRKGRRYMEVAIDGCDPTPYLSENGAFLGLSVLQQIKKRFQTKNKKLILEKYNFPWSPYGGLLLRIEALTSGIRPNKDYFLYCDDTEYTNKLSKMFGLYLIPGCKIEDLSDSWNVSGNKNVIDRLLQEKEGWRVYYSVRNQCNFDLSRANSTVFFIFNGLIFVSILSLFSLFNFVKKKDVHYISRYKLIVGAVWQGLRGHLGNKGINW